MTMPRDGKSLTLYPDKTWSCLLELLVRDGHMGEVRHMKHMRQGFLAFLNSSAKETPQSKDKKHD